MENHKNIHFVSSGNPQSSVQTMVFWGHGWGDTHKSFLPWAERFSKAASHILIDFFGFGASPPPLEVWGTAQYADAIAALIREKRRSEDQKIIWVGHSFGGRIGLQLAARHPDLIAGLFLIASAGLPRQRPLWQNIYFKARIALYKALKKLIPFGLPETWLKKTFGSPDYNALTGLMRQILVRVVNEDLSAEAATITCPVTLITGAQDMETPPEIGHRLAQIIPQAKMIVLDGFDHYTILTSGLHQTSTHLEHFIKARNQTKQSPSP